MKLTASVFAWFLVGAFLPGHLHAQLSGVVYAKSPDHPQTFVVEVDKVHQDLRWDAGRHLLFADVNYSTAAYADSTHPTQYDYFTLSFPTVRFDSHSGKFTAKGVAFATLRHGLLGPYVSLNKGVALSIHRRHGRVFAMIVSRWND